MTRSDRVLAQVAAGMKDSGALQESITGAIKGAFHEGFEPWIIAEIAHLIAESSMDPNGHLRDWHAIRLLNAMEKYACSVLTAKAEIDTPLEDDEDDA